MAERKQPTSNTPKRIPAQLYANVFEGNADGVKILEELMYTFYDQPCPVNADGALYQGGQRSVFQYILARIAEGKH